MEVLFSHAILFFCRCFPFSKNLPEKLLCICHKTGVSFVADTNITCSGTPTAPAPAPAPASVTPASVTPASVTPASATPASATPAATPSPSARRRMLSSSNSTNSTNSSTSTPSPSAPGAEGNDIHSYSCPEFEAVCTCPAGTTEVIPSGANKIAHGGDDPRSFASGK